MPFVRRSRRAWLAGIGIGVGARLVRLARIRRPVPTVQIILAVARREQIATGRSLRAPDLGVVVFGGGVFFRGSHDCVDPVVGVEHVMREEDSIVSVLWRETARLTTTRRIVSHSAARRNEHLIAPHIWG